MTNKSLEEILDIQSVLISELILNGWMITETHEHDNIHKGFQVFLRKGTKECDVLPLHQGHCDTIGWCLEAYRHDADLDVAYITDKLHVKYMINYFNKEVR